MADADEDAIPTSSHPHSRPSSSKPPTSTSTPNNPEDNDAASPQLSDDEDETVDFRFLSNTGSSKAAQGLPKRGTKDFEPNPTLSQRNTLDASRRAMHDALSALRVHAAGKTHNIGVYVNWERVEEVEVWSAFRGLVAGSASAAGWRKRCVVVYNFKGTHSKTVGRGDRRGWTWLLPEEALYLVERGSLDVRWPIVEQGEEREDGEVFGMSGGGENEDEELDSEFGEEAPPISELPMSLQGAYASFIGKSGLTLERYLVYAGLKRSGYIVQRAPTWDDEGDGQLNGSANSASLNSIDGTLTPSASPAPTSALSQPSLIHRLLHWLINPHRDTSNPCLGPLLAPGLYRNYNDVFRALTLVPYHTTSPSPSTSSARTPKPPFTISYLLYKPTPHYRKSTPPSPDYRVCVMDARTSNVPTMTQIGDLLDSIPEDILKGEGRRIEAKMKHGRRNVLVGVVDMGVISYLRFAEAEIGRYKLFEDKMNRGGKGKGRGPPRTGKGQGGQGKGKRGL